MDWSDKVEAYNIDEATARYNSQSTGVQFYPHSATFGERWGCGRPPGLRPSAGASVRHLLWLLGRAARAPPKGARPVTVPAGLHQEGGRT